MENTIHVEPHVIARYPGDGEREIMAYVASENALIVFRNEDDAEAFRTTTGKYPESEGYEPIYMDAEGLARTCIRHGFSQVCMPEAWIGSREDGADFFKAHVFVKMLLDSVEE